MLAAAALALTLAVTWPLARCFGACLGASQDPLVSVYFLRWVAHALTTPGVRLLDASIFAPYGATLGLGEYAPVYAVLALPTILLTGNPVAGHNVVVVAAYVLAALGAAALARRLTGAAGVALLGGLAFAYSPRMLHQAHNIQGLAACWLPWLFLALERFLAAPTWPAAIAVAAVGVALGLSSPSGFLFAGVAAAIMLGVAWRDRPLGRRHFVRLAGTGGAAVLLLWLQLAPFRALAREWRLGRTLADNERYSAALADYLGVPPEHLLHRWIGIGRVVDLEREALFPGVVVAGLAALGLWATLVGWNRRRPALLPYVVMAAVAAVLALGPALATPWGAVPMPYRLLYAVVPGFDMIRAPRRFAVFLSLGLAMLAAVGAARLLERFAPRGRGVAIAALGALVLLESLAVPFPGTVHRLEVAALPEVYRWLAREDPRTVALELPMGDDWEKVGAAAFHLRRTVNGWSSYTPPHYQALVAAMAGFPDARALALIRGVRPDVVLVERRWLGPGREAALAAAESGIRLERVVGGHLVYRVEGTAPPGVEVLEVQAEPMPGGRGDACVTLRNPGREYVPLYPLRRLRLALEGDEGARLGEGVRWLPLDLAPGAAHRACVRLRGAGPPARVRGEVDGAGRVLRFVATPGGPPRPLAPAR
ncbi:MAG: hypothetical protein HYV62_13155 [Candidatus Rokubacteria bacterium]|nr:hypothetical protein [Candidatus Rokubacteria bacterium]